MVALLPRLLPSTIILLISSNPIHEVLQMIDVNDLRKGVTFELDDTLFKVLDYEHHKPGRGKATIRVKARNLRTGTILDKSFISGDRVNDVRLDYHNVQYLYSDGELYHFMDLETYEQPALSAEILGDMIHYLKAGLEVQVPNFVEEGDTIRVDTRTGSYITRA